ncbi:unnamed protein product [Absidia cylindrospora]
MAAKKAVSDGTRKMGPATNVKIKHDPTGEKLKAAVVEASSNDDQTTNMKDLTPNPLLTSDRTSTTSSTSPPPPPTQSLDSYSKRAYGSTYRHDADFVNRETSRWSKYDNNYRYQQHSREYPERRYYKDDRYRDPPHPSSSLYTMSHPPYSSVNHGSDRYISTSRSSSSSYGTPPPPPPPPPGTSSKWDQSKQSLSSGSASIYSTYNSRNRSRSPIRSVGGRDLSRGHYENGYSSRHRSTYDSSSWDRDWDRRRKQSDSWTSSNRDDNRRSREERQQPSNEKQSTLVISRKDLPFVRGILEELRKVFYPHRSLDIYHDENVWCIVFDSIDAAKRALAAMEGQSLLGYVLQITLQVPSTSDDTTTQALSAPLHGRSHDMPTPLSEPILSSTSPKLNDDDLICSSTTTATTATMTDELLPNTNTPDNDTPTMYMPKSSVIPHQIQATTNQPSSLSKHTSVKDHAKQLLLEQLSDVFLKDLKNRVVGPCIYDFLNPALHNKASSKRVDLATTTSTSSENDTATDEPFPPLSSSSLSTSASTVTAIDQNAIKTETTTSTDDRTTTLNHMHIDIKKEVDGLFTLPKPEENLIEGTLPSLGKLPKFKKRTNGLAAPVGNGTLHTHKRPHQRASPASKQSDGTMNDSDTFDDDHDDDDVLAHKTNGKAKIQRKRPSTIPSSNDTSTPILSNMERSTSADFFSNSEDEPFTATADRYSDNEASVTTNTVKGSTGRKKQRRIRDFISSDDEESDVDQQAHETFLRQLHKPDEYDQQIAIKTEIAESNDSGLGDNTRLDRHIKKQPKSKKRHEFTDGQKQQGNLDVSELTPLSSNISKGQKKRKKGASSALQQRKSTKVSKGNKGSDFDIDIGGTSEDEMDINVRMHQPQLQSDFGVNGIGMDDDNDDKPSTTTNHPEPDDFDQEAYERMLLAPDSSSNEDEENYNGFGEEQVNALDLHPDWDPFRLVQDGEDFGFLRLAILEKLGFGANIPEMDKVTEKAGGGCARSRGYSIISDAEKATYLPKNMAVLEEAPSTGGGRLPSSRATRVNNRRFVVGMVMQKKTMADSDILTFNQLKGRKKQLRFAKSPIHDWGLYAEEHIDANDMVIEYVGEVIRQQVAEEREKIYERCGIGSSYLFRVDNDIVIDATKKGSIARFINHCCTPNCSAKIITVDKQKKIVIYANRDIEPGEEITYDYKFPREDDKIPCLCGSKFCKRTLN